jgi:polyisoprenoid-binding protein YceI
MEHAARSSSGNPMSIFLKPHATRIAAAAGLAALLLAAGARATEFNQLQPDKSAVTFAYKQMNVPMEGRFNRFSSRISFDPSKPTAAQAEIAIELASIDTGSPEGNDEVAGKLWFNTKQFPVARFVASSIKPLGSNRFEVAGKMSIKGRTHDVTTPATFRQAGPQGVFEGSFVLKRADYGIGEGMWADFGTVANEVQIKFRLVAAAAAGKK